MAPAYGRAAGSGRSQQKPAKPRLHFELFADIEPQLDRPQLVEGLLEHNAMSVLYGESNTGKTFVALDIALPCLHRPRMDGAPHGAGLVRVYRSRGR